MSHTDTSTKKPKSSIFSRNINNKYKLIPFNESINTTGETKYFPPASKEWKNSVYSYNQNTTKNFPVLDTSIYNIIKSYFNLYFNHKFIFNKLRYRSPKISSDSITTTTTTTTKSYNKIFVSKPEIKHTNSKALITIYTFNKEGRSLLKRIYILKKSFFKIFMDILHLVKWSNIFKGEVSSIFTKTFKVLLFKELILIRRLKLKLNLNKYKFEEKFLYKLSKLISRFYNKKVVFNIVNLKYVMFNSDIFTDILTSKLKNIKANPYNLMNKLFNKAIIPDVNRIKEKTRKVKTVNFDLISNKFRDININNILVVASNGAINGYPVALAAHKRSLASSRRLLDTENSLDNILKDLYHNVVFNSNSEATISEIDSKNYTNIYNTIFNSINYKNTYGVRFEVKGRLTRRYRADRAVYKFKWKGGLRNIDSSYKGLSSVNFRGFTEPNVQYSINTSKRRVGAFAVKGWVSGK
jgi:hypothetical protein